MSIAQEFNDWQADYTEKIKRWVPHYTALLQALTAHVPAGFHPARILDLGCGNGNSTAVLVERFPDAHYTLLDASSEMLSACIARFGPGGAFEYVEAFFQDAPFSKESFDMIAAVLALHHVPEAEKPALFKQLFNWLAPGGVLSYSDLFATKRDPRYNETVLKTWEDWAFSRGTSEAEWAYLLEHHEKYDFPSSVEETKGWLEAAGFRQIEVTWQVGDWGNIQARRPA